MQCFGLLEIIVSRGKSICNPVKETRSVDGHWPLLHLHFYSTLDGEFVQSQPKLTKVFVLSSCNKPAQWSYTVV